MSITITITGSRLLAADLYRAATALEGPGLTNTMKKWAKRTAAVLKSTPYPPQEPHMTYVRTGRLASSWSSRSAGFHKVEIHNSAEYASLVVGEDTQIPIHESRWWVATDIIEKELDKLVDDIGDEVVNPGGLF